MNFEVIAPVKVTSNLKKQNMMSNNLITALGTIFTVIGLFYAGRQFQLSRRLAKHQFMLQLFEKMDSHNDIHERATSLPYPNDEWPETRKEWIQIGRLLGLYEHIGHLVEDKIISIEHVDTSFSYRLAPIIQISKISKFIYSDECSWVSLKMLIIKLESQKLYSTFAKKNSQIGKNTNS